VEIFISNLDKYFAAYELAYFKAFLENSAYGNPFYVLTEDYEVIACGGYEKEKEAITLTWGMVKRAYHGQGYGKELTLYRLNEIQSKYPGTPIQIGTSQHTKGFYEKQGFVTQEIEKDGYEPGLDKYIMMKK
jgi:predicted GNAT family N-acyltransferase